MKSPKRQTPPKVAKARKRIDWRQRALDAEARFLKTRDDVIDAAKFIAEKGQHESNALKGKIFDLTAENSPWIKQNHVIRKLMEARVKAVKRLPPFEKAVAAVLGVKAP